MEKTKVYEQMFRYETGQPGKTVVVTGGVHGDELTGIEVVRNLMHNVDSGALALNKGTLYLVLGNPEAIRIGARGSAPGKDLNRCFTQANLVEHCGSTYEHYRARELAEVLKSADVIMDIHATSKPSEPFVFCQRLPTAADYECLKYLNVKKVLADPDLAFAGEPVAIDEYVGRRGGVGLCYETGFAVDTSRVAAVQNEVEALLVAQHVVHGSEPTQCNQRELDVWAIRSLINCHDPQTFSFAPQCGEYNFQPFASGQTLAYQDGNAIVATHDGAFVFPKPSYRFETGKPVCWLATRLSR